MYAMLNGLDGHLHWSKVPNPVLENGQVLLEIHAAALNRADLLQRAGEYPPPPGWPDWFGLEASGIIKEMTPDAEREGRFHVGDSVCALLGGGGYAEYAAVPEGMLMPIPKGLTMEEAAALPEAFGAAYLFLGANHYGAAYSTFLDVRARYGALYRYYYHVAYGGIAAAGATEHMDAERFFGATVVCNYQSGFTLYHVT